MGNLLWALGKLGHNPGALLMEQVLLLVQGHLQDSARCGGEGGAWHWQ